MDNQASGSGEQDADSGSDFSPQPSVDNPALQPEEPELVAHAAPGPDGSGLDGDTPLEVGIMGRGTEAGLAGDAARRSRDWEPYVDVDQPVQGGTE